jgi:hypothetical protein
LPIMTARGRAVENRRRMITRAYFPGFCPEKMHGRGAKAR